MEQIKPVPVGVEFYKRIIDGGYYYVDKTLLIYDLLVQKSVVTLFTRPRRFGKTLTQSMLRVFFEKEILPDGTLIDNSKYFQDKKIMEKGENFTKYMGQYPVIFMSLKSAKQPVFEMAYESIINEIISEYNRHRYVLDGQSLLPSQKRRYNSIMEKTAGPSEYALSLKFLSECLGQYHNQRVIILLDEYDVPLENAYFEGFYNKMVLFIRSLFESALKTNENLEFAVVTGCLRISKENIFTGLNNLETISVMNENYSVYFGFVQDEVDEMLSFYGIEDKKDEIRLWYDGYLFGNTEVYNPWSLTKYVKDILFNKSVFPEPYWSNTSSNSIVRELIENADDNTKRELEKLIAGDTIEKPVHEDITYADVYQSQDNLWNFLFFTGYLKAVEKKYKMRKIYISMKIPNEEILYIYEEKIQEWSEQYLQNQDLSELIQAFDNTDCKRASDIITGQLLDTISFYDYKKDYYHGFLAGLLKHNKKFSVTSNRESGLGRYDLILKTRRLRHGKAIILELKVADNINGLEKGCKLALEQIERLHYDNDIIKEGFTDISKFGVCFCKKECMVLVR